MINISFHYDILSVGNLLLNPFVLCPQFNRVDRRRYNRAVIESIRSTMYFNQNTVRKYELI